MLGLNTFQHASMRRFQAKSCEGEMPAWRATNDTLIPGCIAFSTRRTFSPSTNGADATPT